MYDTVAAEIRIAVNQDELLTYVAKPVGNGPWPGVVVLHDATGMSRDLRNQADWMASEGYLAAAPDLSNDRTMVACLRSIMADYLAQQGPTFAKLEAVHTWLKHQPDATGRTGVIGFCLGGGFALQLAPRPGCAVSSVNYGILPKDLETFLNGACPLVAAYGGKDLPLRGSAANPELALTSLDLDYNVKEYRAAGRSLLNHLEDSDLPWLLTMLGQPVNSRYNEPAADDARRRIMAFFARHLKTPL